MLSSHLGYPFYQFVATQYTTKFYVIKLNTNSTFYSLADPLVLGVMLILGLPTALVRMKKKFHTITIDKIVNKF